MKNIITVQHTQSVHHTNGMVGSWTDWDLSDLGRQQADNIGRNLVDYTGGAPFVLYSSDLKRAKQTAEAIGRHLGLTPILRTELRRRGVDHLKVVYSEEPPVGGVMTDPEHPGRNLPGSVAFVPSVMGLIMAGEVIKDLLKEEGDAVCPAP